MGKIWTKAQHRKVYETIAKAEGEQCLVCKIEKGKRKGPTSNKLVIEHADNNEKNGDWGNLHLACYSCNKKMEKWKIHDKIRKLHAYGDQIERERKRENLPTWADVLKDESTDENASTEFRISGIFFNRWKRYVHKALKEQGAYSKKELTREAAAYAGCKLPTSINYLTLYTASNMPCKEDTNTDGEKVITFRTS